MSTAELAVETLLERASAVAKAHRNVEIMDVAAILHGYLELIKLDPANDTYRKGVDEAAANLSLRLECAASAT